MIVHRWWLLCCWLVIVPVVSAATATPASAPSEVVLVAKVNFNPIFVGVSDAMGFVKQGDDKQAKAVLIQTWQAFQALSLSESEARTKVQNAFGLAVDTPSIEHLSELSVQLYALEKQQNPIDYRTKQASFAKRVAPVLVNLRRAIDGFDGSPEALVLLKQSYELFNRTWVANERVVRNTSMAHYGKIETAMALLRVAIESDSPSQAQMLTHFGELSAMIDSYNRGDKLQENTQKESAQTVDLAYGLGLLRSGLSAFEMGDVAGGQAKLGEFIQIWPSIESDVATINPSLYTDIESQVPVIMARGQDSKQQQALQALIDRLQSISPDGYGVLDAMLILLREGLEALLIVMTLLTAMKAAGQERGKRYIYAGVATGLLASAAGALALQQLFPAMSSGTNREMLEGVVGVFAVLMMFGVGAWLHSKASAKAWNAYIKKHTALALSTGSFVGLFGLSFLSVFREGAETILFYVGILPKISMYDFVLGVVIALLLLAIVAVILVKTSLRLPIPALFKVLTVLIYVLGFKILGVSVHTLQLTGILPMTSLDVSALTLLGIYPTVQGLSVQALYVLAVVVMSCFSKCQMAR